MVVLDLDILDLGYLGWNNSKFFFLFTHQENMGREREIFFVTKKHKKEQIQFFSFLYSIDGNFKKSDFFSGLFFLK